MVVDFRVAVRVVDPATAHARIGGRGGDVSDATWTVHDDMARRFARWDGAVVIDTAASPESTADAADRSVGLQAATND